MSAIVLVWFTVPLAAAEVLVTAATGQPYGIATIELPVAAPIVGQIPPPLSVSDDQGRVLFPIANDVRVRLPRPSERPVPQPGNGRLLNRLGNLIREIANDEPEMEQTVARRVTFLIEGDAPVQVRLSESNIQIGVYEITPVPDAAVQRELMNDWWTAYTDAAKRQIDAGDYPPWVENYLVAMLSQRTGTRLPEWFAPKQEDADQLIGTLKLLAGIEGVGETMFRRAAAGDFQQIQPTALPLPAPPRWIASQYPPIDPNVVVEPIASRIPPECLYIRYGSFANYLWFRDLSDEYGGDLSRMVTLRGINDDAARRVETQLNMKMTDISRMLGATVIEDQALFGRDMFLSDGATIGVILQAKNVFLLKTAVNNDRAKLAAADPTVTLTDVKIADQVVTMLSSGDNRVRSFMAVDGDFVCVANSETLIRRFFEVGQSGKSLAATEAFRLSRQLMPVDRGDTIFAYFSPEMLQGLVDPKTLIELRRRLHAKSDIALVHLARIAARSTGEQIDGIEELIAAGFLPTGFGRRPDGSGVISVGDDVIDTRRGARGNFLPIADIEFDFVTQEESQWYSEIADEYSARFPQLDPIMVGVQRQNVPGDETLERLIVHAEVAPLTPEKYGSWAKQLGPPTRVAMKFAPDDIVALQAHVASEQLGPPTHLFVGVKDSFPPDPEQFDGIIKSYRALRELPGYLGAWPQPGAIDRLPLGLGRGRPVGPGMTRLLGGLYRYTDAGFSVISFQPDVLQASLPFLQAVDVNDLATVRMRIGSLTGSKLENWVNDQLYRRASVSSAAGANFLNLLTRQLSVDSAGALEAAEDILGSELQCPLGGQYEYSESFGRWISSAWRASMPDRSMPPGYVAPAMTWFRGAEATLTQYADRLVADAALTVKRQKSPVVSK
ncbi:MAG: hypothetical protein HKN47_22850 [Pirellulaceae bacterium]|nr:hypothetical protein [Pirellulaceae bacterium]